MKSLYAYGCSYTHGYKEEIDKGWVSRLKLNVKYNLFNRGHAGAGWVTVRKKILEDIPKFKAGDIIVVQIPFLYRIEVPYFEEKYDSFMRLWNEHPKGTEEWLKYIRPEHQLEAITAYEAISIFDILLHMDLNILWWSSDVMPTLMNSKYTQLTLHDYNSFFEWNHSRYDLTLSGDERDTHLTSEGYDVMAYEFSDQINRAAVNPAHKLF